MSLRSLARIFLPDHLIARLGNRHTIKRKLLDPFFFRFASHPQEERILYEIAPTQGVPSAALEDNPFIRPPIPQSLRRWYNAPQIHMLTRVTGGVSIEPRTGWPMGRHHQLFLSLHPGGKNPYFPLPPYRTIFSKRPTVALDKIISLRDLNERAYYHFYSDLMSRLVLIQQKGYDLRDYTLVISKAMSQLPFADFHLTHSPLFANLGGIFLQDKEFITCNEALFVHASPMPSSNGLFKTVAENAKASCLPTIDGSEKKIFLTRGPHRKRRMRNSDEIFEVLRPLGFEKVDADTLSMPEQIALFANCRHIVAIHGAGLTNTLYRAPLHLSLFEIHESIRGTLTFNPSYHNIATTFGFDYGATYGEDEKGTGIDFLMPLERFTTDFSAFWATHGT